MSKSAKVSFSGGSAKAMLQKKLDAYCKKNNIKLDSSKPRITKDTDISDPKED